MKRNFRSFILIFNITLYLYYVITKCELKFFYFTKSSNIELSSQKIPITTINRVVMYYLDYLIARFNIYI